PPGTGITSLPPNCAGGSGSVVCLLGDVADKYVSVNLGLTAPPDLRGGGLLFTARTFGAESDFLDSNNVATSTATEYRVLLVTTTADDGAGSLRQAIRDANATCVTAAPCLIGFQIDAPGPWKTIAVASPLPAITAGNLLIDGTWQTQHVGDTNPDGPEIEISGGGIYANGLTFALGRYCRGALAGVAIGGFGANGVLLTSGPGTCTDLQFRNDAARFDIRNVFAGTDPTGSSAHPNGLRGITLDDKSFTGNAIIDSCVLSGNTRSGVFDVAGAATIDHNRLGVKAHSDEPLPNGASGIYIAAQYTTASDNVIAFNRDFGLSVDKSLTLVAFRRNRIWANNNLAIDNGLDGVMTPAPTDNPTVGTLSAPALTRAQYDPATNTTTVEGDVHLASGYMFVWGEVEVYSSDTPGTRNMGDAQRLIGNATVGVPMQTTTPPTHFTATIAGDHTGEWITATVTRVRYETFASVQVIGGEINPRTSELSFPMQVTP
ncbi:MAG TPA: right-handed parallel beta-helix repeat-containing protein, partial [Thermoanaerobaculia bacterium]|nr:right-handed parallel beta-helix repeat-containing protein [Thermoanaerobaculia bacterium]